MIFIKYFILDTLMDPFFGFKTVTPSEHHTLIQKVFDTVASRYDIMNDVMSGSLHRLWKKKLIEFMRPRPDICILDVASGTGDIALNFYHACKPYQDSIQVHLLDANINMLQESYKKAIDQGVLKNFYWTTSDAAHLPFADKTFDIYTIAFGLRNVTDRDRALREAHRVLKKGGTYLCLEFSKINSPLLRSLYHAYSSHVIPKLGQWIAGDKEPYEYLVESIETFDAPSILKDRLESTGFQHVSFQTLTGGITAIHQGIKL